MAIQKKEEYIFMSSFIGMLICDYSLFQCFNISSSNALLTMH